MGELPNRSLLTLNPKSETLNPKSYTCQGLSAVQGLLMTVCHGSRQEQGLRVCKRVQGFGFRENILDFVV